MYPKLSNNITMNVLSEHFTINSLEEKLIKSSVKINKRLGFAVLLKTYIYLGYFPDKKIEIPTEIVNHISTQLNCSITNWERYIWKGRTWKYHISIIRRYFGYMKYNRELFNKIVKDELIDIAKDYFSRKKLYNLGINKFKELRIELPSEKEYRKIINLSYKNYFDSLYKSITANLNFDKVNNINLIFDPNTEDNSFKWLKSPPSKLGIKTILDEISKLKYIRNLNIDTKVISSLNPKLIDKLYKRVSGYDKSMMRSLKDTIRYALFSVFVYMREKELLDNIVKIFLDLIRRMTNRSESSIEKEVVKNVRKIYGKTNILRKLIFAITDNPEGKIRDVILPKVDLRLLLDLKKEFSSEDEKEDYHTEKTKKMKSKYSRHYRQMIKPILDEIDFRTNNSSWDDVLIGVDIIHKYIDTKYIYYPEEEDIPTDLINLKWKKLVYGKDKEGNTRVRKHFFELCVLEKFEKLLKCREIYVYGSLKYRNPVDNLPNDWDKDKEEYYKQINTPTMGTDFINPIKEELHTSLENLNRYMDRKKPVYVIKPKGSNRGYFRVPRIRKENESQIISEIKEFVRNKYNTIDLLDVLIEADKMINFSKFFPTKAGREILNADEKRERLLLNIFSLGTNIELKRVHNSIETDCSYKNLSYFRKRYMSVDSLRNSTTALTNRILEIRNKDIWGISTTCASDGKQFTSYEQNLMASSNPHYPNKGIMVYWHVDNNSTCIYSQLKHSNTSEVIAMIEGLIRHETELKIENHNTDSRGQSEVAFAFCHFLGVDLMPRFSKVKYKKLYTPEKDISMYPNLQSVIEKPINWKLIEQQYDEMVKHVVAIVNGNSSTESILTRFSTYNNTNPTYKAFKELGRAKKTIFLCKYLMDKELRREINRSLNTVENWNSVNSFISYGDKHDFNTNDPVIQEMTVLSLHLLQNAIILVNTILLDKVILEYDFLKRMSDKDLRSLTPLFTSNINPYGRFFLDLNKKSILEAA